jgi:7,8-dihydro-6-hydroxymethylpterin-pyrophosphokinase
VDAIATLPHPHQKWRRFVLLFSCAPQISQPHKSVITLIFHQLSAIREMQALTLLALLVV